MRVIIIVFRSVSAPSSSVILTLFFLSVSISVWIWSIFIPLLILNSVSLFFLILFFSLDVPCSLDVRMQEEAILIVNFLLDKRNQIFFVFK